MNWCCWKEPNFQRKCAFSVHMDEVKASGWFFGVDCRGYRSSMSPNQLWSADRVPRWSGRQWQLGKISAESTSGRQFPPQAAQILRLLELDRRHGQGHPEDDRQRDSSPQRHLTARTGWVQGKVWFQAGVDALQSTELTAQLPVTCRSMGQRPENAQMIHIKLNSNDVRFGRGFPLILNNYFIHLET